MRLILDLMCRFRVDFADHGGREGFQRRFHGELERLQPMVADGLARITDDAIEVTDTGRLFVRNLCMVFDAYLNAESAGDGGSADDRGSRFSRTV